MELDINRENSSECSVRYKEMDLMRKKVRGKTKLKVPSVSTGCSRRRKLRMGSYSTQRYNV